MFENAVLRFQLKQIELIIKDFILWKRGSAGPLLLLKR